MTEQPHINSIHFIGVGGVGMSGIARVAKDQGLVVSGSDLRQSRYTDQLDECGVTVCIGHDGANLEASGALPDVVVVSTAIFDSNPELVRARELSIPIWHRAKMLAYLGRNLQTLAVAGTHGKTTSSSMLATVTDALGLDPTFLIGGIVRAYGSNAHSGQGAYYVVEADESDKSFTYLSPAAVLITNIEADHLDHYRNLEEIYEKFQSFIGLVAQGGPVVVWGDDARLVELAKSTGKPFITYGFGQGCDTLVYDYRPQGVGSVFSLRLPDGSVHEVAIKQNPGSHNALNAAGVITLADALGWDTAAAVAAMADFAGVRRRFDLVDTVAGVTIVDDYAHHPTEIAATIKAAKALDFNRVHVVFQPHRYSRVSLFTEVLHDEFACAFDLADTLTFMNVYSAGETPVPGVTGKTFLAPVLEHEGHPQAEYVARRTEVVPHIAALAQPGDLVITMGAGDVTGIGPELAAYLSGAAVGE